MLNDKATPGVATQIGATIVVAVAMLSLAVILQALLHIKMRRHGSIDYVPYVGSALAIFAVASFAARYGLATRLQCTLAALAIGLLSMALGLPLQRYVPPLSVAYLLLAVTAWVGASPLIHRAARD